MKCSINKKYYFLLLILLFAGGLPAKSSNLDKTKPEDIIRLASYNIRTKGDKGDKAWEVRLNALVDVVRRNKFDMFAIQEGKYLIVNYLSVLFPFKYLYILFSPEIFQAPASSHHKIFHHCRTRSRPV